MNQPRPPAGRPPATLLAGAALLLAFTSGVRAAAAPGPAPGAGPGSSAAAMIATNPDSALALTLVRIAGEPIGLAAAVELALDRSTEVRIARADLRAARGSVRSEQGAFDPELFGEAERAVDDTPTASFFAGADVLQTETTRLAAGARWRLPVGTELTASLNATRLTTNSTFATLSPQYDAFGQLELVQPLLKGLGSGTRSDLTAAERSLEAARARYDDARLAIVADVELTYWSLFAAERDHAVQLLIREQAGAFLREAQLRADAGLAGPGAVASARLFLVQQSQAALDTEERLAAVSDHLATLTGHRPRSGGRFHPQDQPPEVFPAASPDTLVQLAQERSLQVAAAERAVAAARARADGARWNALPQLDAFGTLGGRGLAGTGQEIILDFGGSPDTLRNGLDTGLGDGVEQVLRRDYPTWSAGLRFTVPLGGRDRGERDRLEAEVVRSEQQLEAVRRALAASVRAQQRELGRGRERLSLADQGVQASLEQVRIGLLEYRSGRTTTFELVRLGADLADAQRRYSEALVRTAEAVATLRRLTGGAYPDPGPWQVVSEESMP